MTNEKNKQLRVAILTNTIPRYRTPVFKLLSQSSDFQLRFFVSLSPDNSDPLANRLLDLHYSKTFNIKWKTNINDNNIFQEERLPIPYALPRDLFKFKPDIIISGDLGIRSTIALIFARLMKIPLLIWTEETIQHDAIITKKQKQLRRFLLPRADGFLAWGKSAVNFLRTSGIEESKITYCAQAVNNQEWSFYAACDNQDKIRNELNLKGSICLAVGRLIPRKGFKEMLEAYGALPTRIKHSHSIIIVGEGPERSNLEKLAQALDIKNFFMVGSKSPDILAQYYRLANFMVLPSLTDVWGLVVNESMACGTPVISSIYAGATEELVTETGIGEKFDPLDQENFTSVLERWLESPPKHQSKDIVLAVNNLNFDISVNAITEALLNYTES